jgi:16S rRNA (cytosine1402-N4)-methyltransferase
MEKENNNEASSKEESGFYHEPVLLHECIEALSIKPAGAYVDVTFGGGGHSKVILDWLGKNGKLFAFDQDVDAQRNAIKDKRFTLIHANFRDMHKFLRLLSAIPVDGLLADLGVSSWQFDTAERGFSYRFDGPLDMRMNRSVEKSAADVLNEYSAAALQKMLGEYGEVRNAKTLANAIVEARATKPFEIIADLKTLAAKNAKGDLMKYLSQVFQAIRIEVNDELGALKELLKQSEQVLKPGGRLVVITFHSLEDRLVKNYMKHGTFEDEPVKDFFGNVDVKWRLISKKPVEAGEEEVKRNPRARSAKLRIAERV